MKDILIGLIISICCFIVVDFIYTENHTCGYGLTEIKKCGIIKDKMDIDIKVLGRYW